MKNNLPEANLNQRGRASFDFLGHMFHGTHNIRTAATEYVENEFGEGDELPEDLDQRVKQVSEYALQSPATRVRRTVGEWHASNHGQIAVDAFEALGEEFAANLHQFDKGSSSLTLDDEFDVPSYWEGVEFHRTSGGWDGHQYMGFIHGELVHKKMVDVIYPGAIFKQRCDVAKLAPKDTYEKILEMGTSTGHYTLGLALAYPDASITGLDLSARALEHTLRVGNANNYSWDLYRRPAERTGFDDNTFDLVSSYILLHELPLQTIKDVFAEAFRVLKPGGDMLMSDVVRYAQMNKLQVSLADEDAAYGGEPFWRESASADLEAIADEAGFTDVRITNLGTGPYPYVVIGSKPL